jgi:hypothetical protein
LIFCFRWRDLVEGDEPGDAEGGCDRGQDTLEGSLKKTWMAELSIVRRVVACPLQPLKVPPSFLCPLSPNSSGLTRLVLF